MRCGRGHDHANIQEVKACYNLPADLSVRQENLVPEGPAPASPRAQEIAQKKAKDALERQKAAAGEIHGFTARCPQCVAGTHPWNGFRDVYADEEIGQASIPEPPSDSPRYRSNKYGGTCFLCGAYVKAEQGLLGDRVNGKFTVRHKTGQCKPMPDINEAAERVNRTPFPDVPEGHYAIPSLTGNNDLDFFRVDRPTEGTYAGKTYVKRVIGGKPDKNIRYGQYREVLGAILKFGVDESGLLYAQKIRACRYCNRHLTQYASRQLGCGPDCAAQRGMGDLWEELQSTWQRENPGKDTKDLGDEEGWLDQQTLKERTRRADAMAAAEDATWD